MKIDVVVSGLNVVDLLFTLPNEVQLGNKHEVSDILLQGGAPAGNAASVMATLGLKTVFLGYVGDSVLNVVAQEELKRCHVDTSFMIKKTEHSPAIALVEINPNNGERTVFYSQKNYLTLAEKDINHHVIAQSRLLFVDGYDLDTNLALLKIADELNIISILDIETGESEKLKAMLALGSHCILPLQCAQTLTAETQVENCLNALSQLTKGQLIITDGANGSWAFTHQGIIHQPIFQAKVVDTTGCGDSYHGAYAYALLQGKNLLQPMAFATAYAAIVSGYVGGRTYHPSAVEVEEMIFKSTENTELSL